MKAVVVNAYCLLLASSIAGGAALAQSRDLPGQTSADRQAFCMAKSKTRIKTAYVSPAFAVHDNKALTAIGTAYDKKIARKYFAGDTAALSTVCPPSYRDRVDKDRARRIAEAQIADFHVRNEDVDRLLLKRLAAAAIAERQGPAVGAGSRRASVLSGGSWGFCRLPVNSHGQYVSSLFHMSVDLSQFSPSNEALQHRMERSYQDFIKGTRDPGALTAMCLFNQDRAQIAGIRDTEFQAPYRTESEDVDWRWDGSDAAQPPCNSSSAASGGARDAEWCERVNRRQ